MAKDDEFPLGKMEYVTDRAMADQADKEMRSFRRGVENWTNRPKFYKVRVKNGYATVSNDQRWIWVNYGTPPHTIIANGSAGGNGRNLAFNVNWEPKTLPNRITSIKGARGKYGPITKPAAVKNPGIEGRRWDEQVLEKADERFQKSILKELDKVITSSTEVIK